MAKKLNGIIIDEVLEVLLNACSPKLRNSIMEYFDTVLFLVVEENNPVDKLLVSLLKSLLDI